MRSVETSSRSVIRPAKYDDLDAIMEIEGKCFPGQIAYSKRQMAYLLLHANSASFVESCGGVIRGFVIVTYRQGSKNGNVETLDVDPHYAKMGIGLKLLTSAETDMVKQGKQWSQLEVSEGNKVALRLYKKAGYRLKERLKGYYRYDHGGTRDAMRMVKAIPEVP
jgi:[ribosomal protein S18]-alanine N-acetyltransferase